MAQEQFYESEEDNQGSQKLNHTHWKLKIKPFNPIKFLVTSLRRQLKVKTGDNVTTKDDPVNQQPLAKPDEPYEDMEFYDDDLEGRDTKPDYEKIVKFRKGVPCVE